MRPVQGPADQLRVGEGRRVAQLGVVQRREVVHRDHGGGPAGRWDHEVRAVHDVGGADEPLERRASRRAHRAWRGRAGMGRWRARDSVRQLASISRRRRQLTA